MDGEDVAARGGLMQQRAPLVVLEADILEAVEEVSRGGVIRRLREHVEDLFLGGHCVVLRVHDARARRVVCAHARKTTYGNLTANYSLC